MTDKKMTSMRLDGKTIKQAREKMINMSEVAEKAIKAELGIEETRIDHNICNCEFCGREGEAERKDNINTKDNGLTWLWPDEKWICNICLKSKSRRITKND